METTNKVLGKKRVFSGVMSKYGIFVVLAGLFIVLSLATTSFLTAQNLLNVLRQISINGILAIGVTFIIITGGIDLSLGAILAFSGVVATSFAHPEPYYPVIVIVLIGVGVGAACGAVNGSLVAFLKIPPFIATLGMTTIAKGCALVFTDGRSVIDLSDQFKVIGQGTVGMVPIPVIIFLIVIATGFLLLHRTRFGRYVFATGGNEDAANASGVNTKGVKFAVYTMAGVLCGLAGVMLASRTSAGSPAAGVGYELDAIAAAALGGTSLAGGKGAILWTIAGALIIGILSNGLDILNVSSYIQQIVKGIIIVGAVLLDQISKK